MPSKGQTLHNWENLDFIDFNGFKNAVLPIDGGSSGLDRAVAIASDYPPGHRVPAHSHQSGHIEVIVEGSLQVSGKWEHPGDMRVAGPGQVYGPLIAGPEGCKAVEFFPSRDAIVGKLARESDLPELLGSMTPEELEEKAMKLLGISVLLEG